MVRVLPVHLAYNPRALWFDPGELDIAKDVPVVVETARGLEFGRAAEGIIEVEDEEVKALKSPLKPVVRIATAEDEEAAAEMAERGREALAVFKEMAAEANEDMHPVSVEFLLEGDKAVFYFEAEERVDFRELVRKLAARFHVRIDMRQIGVRDEARMVGGLGHCGQVLCCKRMGGEFCPVSIRMAKEQDLSLNPQKISGLCGRLMCCLRYEYEAYKEFKQRAPKAGSKVSTPEGESKVLELDVLREAVKLSREDEKPILVPLSAFEAPKEGKRPSVVSAEGWEEALAEKEDPLAGEALTFLTSQFTGTDKLAEAGAVRRTERSSRRKQGSDGQSSSKSRSQRSRRSSRSGQKGRSSQASSEAAPARQGRRRRSTTISAEGGTQTSKASPEASSPGKGRSAQGGSTGKASSSGRNRRSRGGKKGGSQRPGQKSSGLQASKAASANGAPQGEGAPSQKRRRRRRRGPRPAEGGTGSSQGSTGRDGQ